MEYQALYRQFRPANFDEIVEQKAAVATLRKTVQTGKIGHAYLFCGQRGTGKTSIARVFARAINCENPVNGNPCNKCSICRGIMDGSLMDVIEIDAASNRSIDNIRSICEEVSYAPSRARYKVYIIDEVHMITTEAFNALLKTLEEPPAHAVFLFATTEPHQIPATILSRCQRFDFRRISTDAIVNRLRYICSKEDIKATDDALTLIASMSDGAMRDAISYLDQASSMASGAVITPEAVEDMTGTVNIDFIADMAEILINGSFDKLLVKCRELSDSGRDFIQFTLDLADYFRNLMIIMVVPDPLRLIPASPKTLKRMYEIAKEAQNVNTVVAFVSSLSKIVSELKWSPSVRTSFEISMLRLCGRKVKAEEVPLTIPDFEKLQRQAAEKISKGEVDIAPVKPEEPAPEVKAESEVPVPKSEDSKKEEPKTALPDLSSLLSSIKNVTKTEDKPEEKPEEKKPEDIIPVASPLPDPEPQPEPQPESQPLQPQDEATEEEVPTVPAQDDDEVRDEPMENQLGLIFDEAEADKAPKLGIFADLSDSVLDDMPYDEEDEGAGEETEEEEQAELEFGDSPDSDLQAPTGRIGETRKSALANAVNESPIVKSKKPEQPQGPDRAWLEIKSRVNESDHKLGAELSDAQLKILGNGAYVVISGNDPERARNIGINPGFKKVTGEIKRDVEGIERVFICTNKQYQNMENKFMQEKGGAQEDKAEAFIRGLGAAGINTEIHFGDD